MKTWDEKPCHLEQGDCFVADKGQVEIAARGSIGVERGAIVPSSAGYRAAAQHDAGPFWYLFADDPAKLLEPLDAASERQADDVAPFLVVRQSSLPFVMITRHVNALRPVLQATL
jgi:hypothetical protein